jgi:hypothetical protein
MPAADPSESDLYVTALAVAVREDPEYRPVSALPEDDHIARIARSFGILRTIPIQWLMALSDDGDAMDVCAQALTALGVPADEQPLYLVRSGPLPDPYIAVLARLVQRLGWRGEDTGITHLDEAGGTAVFDLLDWSTGPGDGATAVILDEPLFADVRVGTSPVRAVAVRVCRGAGPLRVLGWGEGDPEADGPDAATHLFDGRGPCDGWLDLHTAALSEGLSDGDQVLIRARGGSRHGWVRFEVRDAAGLRCAVARTAGMELVR